MFNKEALKKFIDYSFDPELGWVRKPNTSGEEKGRRGNITFHIGSNGSRLHKYSHLPSLVATYGDSYTFCRQVTDDETWQARLAECLGIGVLNYGVGNYGVDQAQMRYERTTLPDSVKIVIIGFVPETICRIQSYWKHYLEFGNTFAFKPRFELNDDGMLTQLPNIMRSLDDFERLNTLLPTIQAHDIFYKRKFRELQFRLPYTISMLKHPVRHLRLISAIVIRECFRWLRIRNGWAENLPFSLIMCENILQSHALYGEKPSKSLLKALLLRFKETAISHGHLPLVVVMPQLFDLRLIKKGNIPYGDFFEELNGHVPVIDMTQQFLAQRFEDLYINDQYGGHLSPLGNELVSRKIASWINMNSPKATH